MPKYTVYLDGNYLRMDEDLLEFFAPGKMSCRGVFETMRCVGGNIDFLEEHLRRLKAGLKILKISHRDSIARLARTCAQVAHRNPSIKLGRFRLMVFQQSGHVHCLAALIPYQPPSAGQYRRGLKVKLVQTDRPATARFANLKSLDCRLFAGAYNQARAEGFDEALLINSKGNIFEASRANVFLVSNGRLLTPPLSSGCLNGIIRRQLIKAARSLGVPVQEKNFTPAMLKNGKMFLTNSMMGIIAIKKAHPSLLPR